MCWGGWWACILEFYISFGSLLLQFLSLVCVEGG